MSSKKKPRIIIVELNPYDSQLIVQFGGTQEGFREDLKDITDKDSVLDFLEESKEHFITSEGIRARTYFLPLGYAMWLSEEATVPILAHECLHVIQELFRRVGIAWTEDTDEASAYLLEKTIVDIVNSLKIK